MIRETRESRMPKGMYLWGPNQNVTYEDLCEWCDHYYVDCGTGSVLVVEWKTYSGE